MGGKWYRGVVEAAECFMTRWHRDEAESSWLRHTTEDAKSDDKGRGGREREGGFIIVFAQYMFSSPTEYGGSQAPS